MAFKISNYFYSVYMQVAVYKHNKLMTCFISGYDHCQFQLIDKFVSGQYLLQYFLDLTAIQHIIPKIWIFNFFRFTQPVAALIIIGHWAKFII